MSLVLAAMLAAQTPEQAQALEAKGDLAAAEKVWQALVAANPNDYRYRTSLGIVLARERKFPNAIAAYRKALQLHPNAPVTRLDLGLAYFKSGNFKLAVPELKAAAGALPGKEQIEALLGMALYGTRRYREAVPHLEAAEKQQPDNEQLRLVLAQACLWSGEYARAKQEFRTMLLRNPDSPQVHMLLGEAYDALGDSANAIAEFRQAANANLPDAHFGLGYLLWKRKQYAAAASEFQKELIIESKNNKAMAYLGDCELNLGKLNAAKKDLLAAIAVRDELWRAQFDLGRVYAAQRNYQSAVRAYQRAIQLDPDRPTVHYRLAQLYRSVGKPDQAKRQLAIVAHIHAKQDRDLIVKLSRRNSEADMPHAHAKAKADEGQKSQAPPLEGGAGDQRNNQARGEPGQKQQQ